MKHTLPVTLILIGVFIASQAIGLGLIAKGASVSIDEQGNRIVEHEDTALGARPETEGFASFTYLIVGIAIGTAVLLILVRFRMVGVWKLWFFLAVWLACTVSIGTFTNKWVALVIALGLAYWKIFKPNMVIHNITEVLVYAGIAILIVPIFNVFYMSLVLIVIAIYDAWAVWKSKHMVAMAQFQTDAQLFAGLFVPYKTKTPIEPKASLKVKAVQKPEEGKSAILGGGDIAFPMLFAGAVMDGLLQDGLTKIAAYTQSLIIVFCATLALLFLFLYAKKDQFYPAMPFITAGCFVGYGIVWLISAL